MIRFLKQLLCPHSKWSKGRPLAKKAHRRDFAFANGKDQIIPWTCCACGKTKQFTKSRPPKQFVRRKP